MSKIPTAEELYNQEYSKIKREDLVYGCIDEYQAQKMMIEFAKLHVKAQKEAILNKAQLYEDPYTHCPECGNASTYIDEQSIINAYPEENIK